MGCSGAEGCPFGQHIGAGFCNGFGLRQCFGCSQRIGRCEKGDEEEECLELHIGAGRVLDRDFFFKRVWWSRVLGLRIIVCLESLLEWLVNGQGIRTYLS